MSVPRYHILLAEGSVEDGQIVRHRNRVRSGQAVALGETDIATGASKLKLKVT